jgi:hypothetical protein
MKTGNSKTASQNLAGIIQTARLRVVTAESEWKAAKEHARMAKRRRKEVKLIARRAKKLARQAKTVLAEARKALAEAEARLAQSGVRKAARKPAKAKAKPVARRAVAAPRKKAAPARKGRSRSTAPSPARRFAAQVGRVSLQKKVPSPIPAPAESVIGKPDDGTPESAVIAGAAAEVATQTQPIQGIQAGKE